MKAAVRQRMGWEEGEVLISAGAKPLLNAAVACVCGPGDEVILPAPYWVSYYEIIRMVGGVPVVVETTPETGLKMTAEQFRAAITPRTKALILNNPCNPTGMMYAREVLEEIAKICVEEDLYVVSDEIYDKLIFDGKTHTCFACLGEDVRARTILINGVAKSYAMTGWRVGYAAGPREIIEIVSNYLSHCTSGTNPISQLAAAEAFTGPQDTVDAMRREFERRRDYLYERANQIPGIRAIRSEGTFYMMLSVEALVGKTLYGKEIRDGEDFSRLFLEKGLVAVVPGKGFGAPNYLRWSFAASMENIKEGLDRLEKFLAEG